MNQQELDNEIRKYQNHADILADSLRIFEGLEPKLKIFYDALSPEEMSRVHDYRNAVGFLDSYGKELQETKIKIQKLQATNPVVNPRPFTVDIGVDTTGTYHVRYWKNTLLSREHWTDVDVGFYTKEHAFKSMDSFLKSKKLCVDCRKLVLLAELGA